MKLATICLAAALAVGSLGLANATPVNLVQNGDFSQSTRSAPWEFGSNYGGQTVAHWKARGYALWYPNANDASTVTAHNQFGTASNHRLPAGVTAPPAGLTAFVALDGDQTGQTSRGPIQATLSQTLSGLTAGAKYVVSFYWAATEEMAKDGRTTSSLKVSLGGASFTTPTIAIPTHGFSGWMHEAFTFTATNTSDILKFLSIGTPSGLPPMALLAGVSVTQAVPEPSALAMFGGGLLGVGLIVVFARRRRQDELDAIDAA